MTVRWEGSWNPSETKTDRPNASETLEITGYEPFLLDRSPGGKIFMYWTARCTKDPWLRAQAIGKRAIIIGGQNPFLPGLPGLPASKEPDGCNPFGAYVPDDLRQAFPDIDKQRFPRTDSILSAADKQRLSAEYARVNPSYFSRMGIEPRPLSNTFQASIPPSTGIVEKPSARLKIFSRGTESAEQAQPEGQGPQEQSANAAASSVGSLSEGMNDFPALPPVAITFDQPLHFLSANGEDQLVAASAYEIEPVLDHQLSLAREGQEAMLLPAEQSAHQEALAQALALLVQGDSDDTQRIVFLTPDGTRYDAVGAKSAVRSRDVMAQVMLPSTKIKDAIAAASSRGPLPPCKQNTLPYGPRWIPVPCAMPAGMPGGLPAAPVPYVDGSNLLHACLDNRTGAFRLVRSLDNCGYDEAKIKWQLAP
jgi:hypothetical protein